MIKSSHFLFAEQNDEGTDFDLSLHVLPYCWMIKSIHVKPATSSVAITPTVTELTNKTTVLVSFVTAVVWCTNNVAAIVISKLHPLIFISDLKRLAFSQPMTFLIFNVTLNTLDDRIQASFVKGSQNMCFIFDSLITIISADVHNELSIGELVVLEEQLQSELLLAILILDVELFLLGKVWTIQLLSTICIRCPNFLA